MNAHSDVQLYLFHAALAPVTVILRQGPGALWRLIRWNRDQDFDLGDWVQMDIDVDRCSLSPDGAHFLWFGVDGKWDRPARGAYTAISKPPSFSPVSLYPQGRAPGGGGYWVSTHGYVLNTSPDALDIVGKAPDLMREDKVVRRSIMMRGVRRRAKHVDPIPDVDLPYTSSGAQLMNGDTVLADFSDMEPAA